MSDHLEPEELDKLQSALVEHIEESHSMPLDVAHGFLTAVAAHPEVISLADARRRIMGHLEDIDGIDPLLVKFQDQLMRDLETGDYGPLIMQYPREDGTYLPIPYGWCEGYAEGLGELDDSAQQKAMDDPQSNQLLAIIFAFNLYKESDMFDPPDEDSHRDMVSKLGEAAVGLYRWWLNKEQRTLQ
ncbi:MAG: UPF0149 family protein [Sedimenticolaceae bacterium]|jgi:uncharacterized protein